MFSHIFLKITVMVGMRMRKLVERRGERLSSVQALLIVSEAIKMIAALRADGQRIVEPTF